jgi:hypothetical protein
MARLSEEAKTAVGSARPEERTKRTAPDLAPCRGDVRAGALHGVGRKAEQLSLAASISSAGNFPTGPGRAADSGFR